MASAGYHAATRQHARKASWRQLNWAGARGIAMTAMAKNLEQANAEGWGLGIKAKRRQEGWGD